MARMALFLSKFLQCAPSITFMWSPGVRSKHPFRAMCCPVNVYCDLDVSCIVIVMYHALISVQLMSDVVRSSD